MTPTATAGETSTRTPSLNQEQVLVGVYLAQSGAEGSPPDQTTAGVHGWRLAKIAGAGKKPVSQRDTYLALEKCRQYGWLDREQIEQATTSKEQNDGVGIAWHIVDAGMEALERAKAARAVDQQPTDDDTDGAPAPDPEALAELDEGAEEPEAETVPEEDTEVEEPAGETEVDREGQLTMLSLPKGKREKPEQFTLKIDARQRKFGTEREYLMDEEIDLSARVRVYRVTHERAKDGSLVKVAHARIVTSDLLDGE